MEELKQENTELKEKQAENAAIKAQQMEELKEENTVLKT